MFYYFAVTDSSATVPASSCTYTLDESQIFNVCRTTYGGDWEWIATTLGLMKATCTYFCPHCLVTSSALKKGEPHTPTIVTDDGVSTLRTFQQICSDNEQYIAETGGDKKEAKKYRNCIYKPLMGDIGNVIDIVSTSPMHVSLGLWLQNVNIMEQMCVNLDGEVKSDEVEYCDRMKEKMRRRSDMCAELVRLERARVNLESDLDESERMIDELKVNRARNKEQILELKEEVKFFKSELKDNGREKIQVEEQITILVKQIDNDNGPFLESFHMLMDDLALKRVVYHSGALIGNDVKKTIRPLNIDKFAALFEPRDFQTANGVKTYSSMDISNKVKSLLTKFSQCYNLYHRNSPLCKHEVEELAYNCADYGEWFPIAFPEASVLRKFHLLTHEIPRQARRLHTVGMLIEQVTESIHPFMNKADYMFIQTQNTIDRQKLMARQHNMFARILHVDR